MERCIARSPTRIEQANCPLRESYAGERNHCARDSRSGAGRGEDAGPAFEPLEAIPERRGLIRRHGPSLLQKFRL
jgi:hypothetical protein